MRRADALTPDPSPEAGEGNPEEAMTQAGTKDHPITIAPIAERVRVVWRGRKIGESARALELAEAGYKPVAYIPRADVDMSAARAHRPGHHLPL